MNGDLELSAFHVPERLPRRLSARERRVESGKQTCLDSSKHHRRPRPEILGRHAYDGDQDDGTDGRQLYRPLGDLVRGSVAGGGRVPEETVQILPKDQGDDGVSACGGVRVSTRAAAARRRESISPGLSAEMAVQANR
jgi:hypothetical protein